MTKEGMTLRGYVEYTCTICLWLLLSLVEGTALSRKKVVGYYYRHCVSGGYGFEQQKSGWVVAWLSLTDNLHVSTCTVRVKKGCQYCYPFACYVQMAICQKRNGIGSYCSSVAVHRWVLAIHTLALVSCSHSLICVEMDELES